MVGKEIMYQFVILASLNESKKSELSQIQKDFNELFTKNEKFDQTIFKQEINYLKKNNYISKTDNSPIGAVIGFSLATIISGGLFAVFGGAFIGWLILKELDKYYITNKGSAYLQSIRKSLFGGTL